MLAIDTNVCPAQGFHCAVLVYHKFITNLKHVCLMNYKLLPQIPPWEKNKGNDRYNK